MSDSKSTKVGMIVDKSNAKESLSNEYLPRSDYYSGGSTTVSSTRARDVSSSSGIVGRTLKSVFGKRSHSGNKEAA